MPDQDKIPVTPLLDRSHNLRGYRLNRMAMSLGKPEARAAFLADEGAFLDAHGLSSDEKAAVKARDWERMVALGGNLFFILKIAAVDPVAMTQIGAEPKTGKTILAMHLVNAARESGHFL